MRISQVSDIEGSGVFSDWTVPRASAQLANFAIEMSWLLNPEPVIILIFFHKVK